LHPRTGFSSSSANIRRGAERNIPRIPANELRPPERWIEEKLEESDQTD